MAVRRQRHLDRRARQGGRRPRRHRASSRRRRARRRATSSTRPTRTPPSRSVFRLFEIYADEAAYAAHGASDHFKEFALEQAIPVLANRERAFYETIGG